VPSAGEELQKDLVGQVADQDPPQPRSQFPLAAAAKVREPLMSLQQRLLDDSGRIKLSLKPAIETAADQQIEIGTKFL
jgi:hypothetical protein